MENGIAPLWRHWSIVMWSSLKKMLTLEWSLFKLSAMADLQVPFNLGLQFINDILWYAMQIILFEALYLHVNNLGGWGIAEMRVFLGVLFLVDAFQMILFAYNFDVFSEKIIATSKLSTTHDITKASVRFYFERYLCSFMADMESFVITRRISLATITLNYYRSTCSSLHILLN
jgi:hypothetical protein